MRRQLALAGRGGMGRRHLRGFVAELPVHRAAACTSIAEARAQRPELVAAGIVATAATHHVAAAATRVWGDAGDAGVARRPQHRGR